MSDEPTTVERLEVARTIPADAADIFRVLRDPLGHVAIDSSGMLQSATGEPVERGGRQLCRAHGPRGLNDFPLGRYDVTVTITTFVPDRHIAWGISGLIQPPIGHIYGYTLEPADRRHPRHVVLRLVRHRSGVARAQHLPDHPGERVASNPRHPRAHRAARRLPGTSVTTSNTCSTTVEQVSAGATILHADLDAFYASVEQLLDPSLQGRPIAVGGGVVLAASYEAKRFGVQGGMSGWRAKQLCPDLLFVHGHFSEYQRLADQVMAVLGDFTPLVQRISIDEAFLDVSGSVHLFGAAEVIGERIRTRVRAEIGLPISVGAARTKHLAKIASQVAKPDGLVVVHPADERAFLDPLPVGLIWGIGPVTRAAPRRARHPDDRPTGSVARRRAAIAARPGARRKGQARSPPTTTSVGCSRRARAGSVGAQSAFGRARRLAGTDPLGARPPRRSRRRPTARQAPRRPHHHGQGPLRQTCEPSLDRTPGRDPISSHADAHRDRRAAGVQGAGGSHRPVPDLAAGDLGVEPRRPAGPATRVADASRRGRASGLACRLGALGGRPLRSTQSAVDSGDPPVGYAGVVLSEHVIGARRVPRAGRARAVRRSNPDLTNGTRRIR